MVSGDRRVVRGLGVVAAVLALAAAFAGSPYAAQHGQIDVAQLARAVAHEDDHVSAIELAGWIRSRRSDLRVIDVRSQDDYDAYHVPTAEHVSLDSLATTAFRPGETIVLYSEGGAHAAQGWVFLRALGYDKVFFLRGGLYDWLDQVMSPSLPANAPIKDSAAFRPIAELSRYFGGVPRFGVTSSPEDAVAIPVAKADSSGAALPGQLRAQSTSSTASLVLKIRRRGC
ncbi:MAG: rhodanese-like domain-containing protein [bacterium]